MVIWSPPELHWRGDEFRGILSINMPLYETLAVGDRSGSAAAKHVSMMMMNSHQWQRNHLRRITA